MARASCAACGSTQPYGRIRCDQCGNRDPVVGHAWVMLAALLALTEEACGDDKVKAIRMAWRLRRAQGRRKVEAYIREPGNRAKIFAKRAQAAEMLGLSGETRH